MFFALLLAMFFAFYFPPTPLTGSQCSVTHDPQLILTQAEQPQHVVTGSNRIQSQVIVQKVSTSDDNYAVVRKLATDLETGDIHG